MFDVKRLCSEDRLAMVGGILSAVGSVLLLSYAAMGRNRAHHALVSFAVLGILSGGGLFCVARFLTGLPRTVSLCGIGWLMILLPGFFGNRLFYGFFAHGLYFLRGGDVGFMTLPLLCLVLVIVGLYLYESGNRTEAVRWGIGSAAALALLMNAVYSLMLLAHRTRWADRVVRTLNSGDLSAIAAFLVVTPAVWTILVLALVAMINERPKPSLVPTALLIARILAWALVGLLALSVPVRFFTAVSSSRGTRTGDLLMWFLISVFALLVPFLVGALLAIRTSVALLLPVLAGTAANPAAAPGADAVSTGAPTPPTVPTPRGSGIAPMGASRSPGPAPAPDPAEALRSLKRLRDENLISPEEYEAKKRDLLARF